MTIKIIVTNVIEIHVAGSLQVFLHQYFRTVKFQLFNFEMPPVKNIKYFYVENEIFIMEDREKSVYFQLCTPVKVLVLVLFIN